MTEGLPPLPASLLQEISRDLRPVKPVPLPSRVSFGVAPVAVLISSLVLTVIGVRGDASALGPVLTWGASLAQFAVAILLVWIAAREGTPAHRLPSNAVWLVLASTCLAVSAITLWTFDAHPTAGSQRVSPWIMGLACGTGATIAGTSLMLFFRWILRHSVAARPALVGGLLGTAAGVAVNAGWRLSCPVATPSHSLGAHGAAIVATAVLGALAAHRSARRLARQNKGHGPKPTMAM